MKVILSMLISLFFSTIMLAQVDSGYVDIKGGQLFYQTFGEGEPLLVICGGGTMGSKGYKVFGTELSINRMVILFDSRGTGRSVSKIENRYTRDGRDVLELEDIEALRKHLKIKKWDILGQTLGARTAMEYIYKYPDQVNRFVISSAFGFGLNDKSSTQKKKMVSDDKYASIIAMVKDELMVESQKRRPSKSRLKRLNAAINSRYSIYNPESIPKIINWWLNETSMADFDIVLPMPTEKDWERIRKRETKMINQFALFNNPVLVIHGKESYMNYLHPERNASIFPNSEMILLEKCGHVVFIDAKEEYFKSINDFLNKESE